MFSVRSIKQPLFRSNYETEKHCRIDTDRPTDGGMEDSRMHRRLQTTPLSIEWGVCRISGKRRNAAEWVSFRTSTAPTETTNVRSYWKSDTVGREWGKEPQTFQITFPQHLLFVVRARLKDCNKLVPKIGRRSAKFCVRCGSVLPGN